MDGNVTSGPVGILFKISLYLILTAPPNGLIKAASDAVSFKFGIPVI